jgi:hypothetical protein
MQGCQVCTVPFWSQYHKKRIPTYICRGVRYVLFHSDHSITIFFLLITHFNIIFLKFKLILPEFSSNKNSECKQQIFFRCFLLEFEILNATSWQCPNQFDVNTNCKITTIAYLEFACDNWWTRSITNSLTRNQYIVSEWSDMSIRGLLFQWASTIKILLRVLV